MRRAVTTLAASLALLSLPAPVSAQDPGGSASSLRLLDVPYLSQGELLCGGAAAAMLMRAAGARGVYAEDFESLVERSAGGIHSRALASALAARGYGVRVFHGDAARARQLVAEGHPVLALIEHRPGRFHYVVIVGWDEGRVVFHDPARAPFLERTEDDFDRSWAPADRWMLVIHRREPQADTPADGESDAPGLPGRDEAIARFVERDYADAAKLASRVVTADPSDLVAWRLLGASRYLSGDAGGALNAWNHAGDPKIDLVSIEGLTRTPHRAAERLMALTAGTRLTWASLVRADRRLALLPSRQASRVSYVALPGNLVEVRGAVVERPPYPSRLEWVLSGARLAINRELAVALANLANSGDRLTAGWRFWEGRRRAALSFAAPAFRVGGVATLDGSWQEEHYAAAPRTERRQATLAWTNWAAARLRVSAGAAYAEWTDRGRAALLLAGLEFQPVEERFTLGLTTVTAAGSLPSFGTLTATARWRERFGQLDLLGDHAVARASADAPLDEWAGAGTGIARPFLLRAHPLIRDGRIAGPAFGRTLLQSSLELQRDIMRRAFGAVAVAAFVDAARAWQRPDGSDSPLHVDVGAGLRLRLAPGFPAIRLDLARGLRDGDTAFSAGWQLTWSGSSTR